MSAEEKRKFIATLKDKAEKIKLSNAEWESKSTIPKATSGTIASVVLSRIKSVGDSIAIPRDSINEDKDIARLRRSLNRIKNTKFEIKQDNKNLYVRRVK